MILLIDNYDSFTYNLYQFMGEFDPDIKVIRNDAITAEEILEMSPDRLVISPGPKAPKDAGNCLDIIKSCAGKLPILGICLGHQCIGEAFGGDVVHATTLFHGKSSIIDLADDKIFEGIDQPMQVARYHSLMVDIKTLPDCFQVLGKTEADEIMAMKHKEHEIYGIQFHPESILTNGGKQILKNFIEG